MDAVTALALSVQNPFLSALGHLLDNDVFYVALILVLVIIFEWKNDARLKILLSLALAFVLGWIVKIVVSEPRPCLGASWCPLDCAFPSLHAAVAFALMLGFVNKKSFPFFLVFALFVSFTRINIGVHTFPDIVGALPIAVVAYYSMSFAWAWLKKKGWLKTLIKDNSLKNTRRCEHGKHD